MEQNKIIVHQAFYGEVNKAHSCIRQTINDVEIKSFLTSFTDRPAALPVGQQLLPYLSASSFFNYYFICKTIPDLKASRSGMVFSHVLIFQVDDLDKINNIEGILKYLVDNIYIPENLAPLEFDINEVQYFERSKRQPKYIQQFINSFILGTKPILFSGSIGSFKNILQVLWNEPDFFKRQDLKFRASFTPSDLERDKDLTIVTIQKEFLNKWQGTELISDNDNNLIDIESPTELLFLGFKEHNLFYNFLVDLNSDLTQIRNFSQYGKLYETYNQLKTVNNADLLRSQIRLISNFSPHQSQGKIIKHKFLTHFLMLIDKGIDRNIKALKNINWDSFENGQKLVCESISNFLIRKLNSPQVTIFELAEIVNLAIGESNMNWWHRTIVDVIRNCFQDQQKQVIDNFWKLIDSSQETLKNILTIITPIEECEKILLSSFPNSLKSEINESLLSKSIDNKWYLFHAKLLLIEYPIEVSIIRQIELEKNLNLEISNGTKYLVKQLSDEELLSFTLNNNEIKLIDLIVDRILNNKSLMKGFNPYNGAWLEMWKKLILKKKEVFYGIHGKEKETVNFVLDNILKDASFDFDILDLISISTFSDISEYVNRKDIWNKMPADIRDRFISSTAPTVLDKLNKEEIEINDVEDELVRYIISDGFMGKLLNQEKDNFEYVLKVYEKFRNLKDGYLADYIRNYQKDITEEQSLRLGNLVREQNFVNSARIIEDKSKYKNCFKIANDACKSILKIDLFESILGFNLFGKENKERYKIDRIMEQNIKYKAVALPVVVILTAIKEEYRAIREHLIDIIDADENDTSYEKGIFKYGDKEIANIVIRECGPKNTTASQEAERAIQYFKPNAMFFVGIAGSRKPNDFVIGDVIFPEKVYSYEGGKSEEKSFVARPDIAAMTYTLIEKAKKERNKDDWKSLIKGNWELESVKADLGVIASGEQVVEHYDSEVGVILNKHFNDTSAVEMEGFGFAKAANKQGRNTRNMEIGIVRGISDIIERSSTIKEDKEDKRPADAKAFASATASAFTFWLILKTFS
ncbi:hypothetical protein [Chryseobacterium sp. SIMBA_028]|uniref:GAP1-N1 domain-containing protein n=2 Tax=Pseudomonadati TaxID=3379134 RepID=UPI00397ADAC4